MEAQRDVRGQGATLSVVMPAYNEAATVRGVGECVLRNELVDELVVVNDGSTDGTAAELEALQRADPRVRVVSHARNLGKGAAVRTALAEAKCDIILIQDADLEYDPGEYAQLIAPIVQGRADVVIGSRFHGAGPHRVLYFWHSLANRVLSLLTGMVTDLNLSDMECGFKVFRREVASKLTVRENGFGLEPELVCKIARLRPRVYEVPVSYYGRTFAEGKKITWVDGIHALRCLFVYGLCRRD